MSVNGTNGSDQLQSEEPTSETAGATRFDKLCPRCQELDLSIDKFVIYDGTFRIPKKTLAQSKPGDYPKRPDFSLKSGSRFIELGPYKLLKKRMEMGCQLCFLLIKSVENIDATGIQEAICSMNWEIDGRENDPNTGRKARTRRLHLHWDNKKLPDSYLVFVAPQRLFDINSDSQGSWEREAFFLGRELRSDGNNQVLMKSWLDQCCQSHGPACAAGQDKEFLEMAEHSFFGVIDCLDMCLKSLPLRPGKVPKKTTSTSPTPVVREVSRGRYRDASPYSPSIEITRRRSRSSSSSSSDVHESNPVYEPYVALSYVWGLTKNYTTEISNIRIHQQQGSLETFLDEIPKVIRDAMDLVRRLGLRYLWVDSLCIVQNSKRSWTLNARMMNVIYGNAHLTICAADGADAWFGLRALDTSGHSTTQHIAECAPGVRLMVSQLAETGINASVWNTRAWTFQERLLSKRCLIFTDGRVFFQCRSATMSEDLVSESHGAGWSLDLAKALPQILHELKRRPIRVYMNCMSRYSERQLTKAKDILAAFNGVSNMISDIMLSPFIFGLPSSHFDLALLWAPLSPVSRRVQGPKEDFQDLVFPSWSWCGWKGGSMEYDGRQLEGVLTNVHEWLTEHTWIAWYIRDGKGNLRPIWDGRKAKSCDSTEDRWKGYIDMPPDEKFIDLQEEALRNLGAPNEDDFIKWSKEQAQIERETKMVELETTRRMLERETRQARNYYEEPPEYRQRHHYPHHHGREVIRIERRDRSRSSGRSRDRDEYRADRQEGDDEKVSRLRDEYGRKVSTDVARKIRGGFQQCLPDNPFRVYIEDYTSTPDKDFPDQPLLQFWTWWASLRLVKSDPTIYINLDGSRVLSKLQKYDIADGVGDWCGSIMLDPTWVIEQEARGHRVDGSRRDFLAISDAKAFTKEECDVWTYYVPKERVNSEWDLYYVLLVEQRDRIWYRIGLGKVFKTSFDNAVMRKRWREIILG
ncbi:HET-domain-containing protein [Acephala macrosclerotiorum]|nr:HET-domain-containing protein [Acephala macrosclerotiorum]